MPFNLNHAALVSLFAAIVRGAPSASQSVDPYCEHGYIVEKWGIAKSQPRWNSSMFGDFKGCMSEQRALAKRGTGKYDTTVEPNNDNAFTGYYPQLSGSVIPYMAIWDQIDKLCGETYCDGTKSVSVDAQVTIDGGSEARLVMSLDGNFANADIKNNFVTLVQQTLYHSVKNDTTNDEGIMLEKLYPAAYLHATSGYGQASGDHLTMRLSDQSDAPGCPSFTSTLEDIGSLVPELAPIFGTIGAICDVVGDE